MLELTLRGKPVHVHANCARFSPLCTEHDGRISGIAAELRRGAQIVRYAVSIIYAATLCLIVLK